MITQLSFLLLLSSSFSSVSSAGLVVFFPNRDFSLEMNPPPPPAPLDSLTTNLKKFQDLNKENGGLFDYSKL